MAKSRTPMTLEVEFKGRVKAHGPVEKRLAALGFHFEGTEGHSDIYFMHPTRDFAETDEALRVRTVDGRAILTYKGPKVDKVSKTREEVEVEVKGDMPLVLERLGFKKVMEVRKVRKVYRKDDIEVCLDDVTDLGLFVEVESKSTDLEATRARVLNVVNALGIKDSDLERRAYLELLLAKK